MVSDHPIFAWVWRTRAEPVCTTVDGAGRGSSTAAPTSSGLLARDLGHYRDTFKRGADPGGAAQRLGHRLDTHLKLPYGPPAHHSGGARHRREREGRVAYPEQRFRRTADSAAKGTILNDDPLPQAWLARLRRGRRPSGAALLTHGIATEPCLCCPPAARLFRWRHRSRIMGLFTPNAALTVHTKRLSQGIPSSGSHVISIIGGLNLLWSSPLGNLGYSADFATKRYQDTPFASLPDRKNDSSKKLIISCIGTTSAKPEFSTRTLRASPVCLLIVTSRYGT